MAQRMQLLAQNLHLDSFSFVYSEAASSTPTAMPWSDGFEHQISSDWTFTQVEILANWALSTSRANRFTTIFHDDNGH